MKSFHSQKKGNGNHLGLAIPCDWLFTLHWWPIGHQHSARTCWSALDTDSCWKKYALIKHLSTCDINPKCFILFSFLFVKRAKVKTQYGVQGHFNYLRGQARLNLNSVWQSSIPIPCMLNNLWRLLNGTTTLGIRIWCWQGTSQHTIAQSLSMMWCMALFGEDSKSIWHDTHGPVCTN